MDQQQFDSELQTYFLHIKHEIKQEHIEYLKKHPELNQILNDFTSQIILEKPDNVYQYAKEYFSFFNQEKDLKTCKPLIVSGASGVGKGTLLQMLFKQYPQQFVFSVSYTTRAPRPGEVHGQHYYFVSKEEFQKEIEKKAFLEYCEVHGNYYGTHLAQVQKVMKQGQVCVIEIDVQGAEKISKSMPNQCNYIFINAPSTEELRKRLTGRGTETEEVIEKRMKNAEKEIEKAHQLGFYNELLNDDLQKTMKKLIDLLKTFYTDLKL
ncbi:unnamed protein product [Paramecium primaurelia]|uniref:guanylate kinase n=1 Tax=Paramecium primaurelia TaxID=5886 RepID=A0A8S1LGX9_PARPR|nr:unnamed protein product [Paramecium primaurelia]